MNINSRDKAYTYLIVLIILTVFLIREYVYVHPYNTGFFILGPRWTYSSTRTFTWWFLLVSSIVMLMPLIRKQKIGLLGLLLLTCVFIRPYIQIKFPKETALEFYKDRSLDLKLIMKKYKKTKSLDSEEIKDLGFEKLVIKNETYYFLVCNEEFPFGICFNEKEELPKENFDTRLKYKKLENNWFEFDYLNIYK